MATSTGTLQMRSLHLSFGVGRPRQEATVLRAAAAFEAARPWAQRIPPLVTQNR